MAQWIATLGMVCAGLLVPIRAFTPVTWDGSMCQAQTAQIVIDAFGSAGHYTTVQTSASLPMPTFTVDLPGLTDASYTVHVRGVYANGGAFFGQPLTLTLTAPTPTPTPTVSPTPTPIQFAILAPTSGATVTGDFTVQPQSSTLPFRLELLKADGTLALPAIVRSDTQAFVVTGAAALPSGSYTLVLKTTATQTPPAASVTFTLNNAPAPTPAPTVTLETVNANVSAARADVAVVATDLAAFRTAFNGVNFASMTAAIAAPKDLTLVALDAVEARMMKALATYLTPTLPPVCLYRNEANPTTFATGEPRLTSVRILTPGCPVPPKGATFQVIK